MMRLIRLLLVVIAGSLVLAGCAVFARNPTASQQSTIGAVAIHFTVCASNTEATPPAGSCANLGNSGEDADTSLDQAWVAFRLPDGTNTPSHFSSEATGPFDIGPTVHFSRSVSYAKQLTHYEKPGDGEQWFAYISQWAEYHSDAGSQNYTATVDFGLPARPGGRPFDGPLHYDVVVGGAEFFPGTNPGDPATPGNNETVQCGGTLGGTQSATLYNGGDQAKGGYGEWTCIDDSYPATVGTNATLTVNDAAIVPGAKLTLSPGGSGKAKFKFEYFGAAHASFKLSASTTVPHGSAHASVSKIKTHGNDTKSITVTVHAGTKRGTYKVKLTAKLANGETRTGTVTIKVT